MRFILGCPPSTRIVNMQTELKLPPLIERIYANVTLFSVKCLRSPQFTPTFSAVLRASLDQDAPGPQLRLGGRILVRAVCDNLRQLEINVPVQEAVQDLPPWQVPIPTVIFTPISKNAHNPLQKQLVLETIATVSMSVPAGHHIYVDGSVQADGSAACAMFSPTIEPPVEDGWHGRRLPDSSSSTYCELQGILDAVTLLLRRNSNGLIISDSKSALQALTSPRPSCGRVVRDILFQLSAASNASLILSFVWMPSHIGLYGNEKADSLAKAACALGLNDRNAELSLRCLKKKIDSAALASTVQRMDAERATSVSIQHYDHFLQIRHKYRRHGLIVRRHNVVSARIRLGYRPVWQVGQTLDIPHYTSCKLCNLANANNLEHYCLHCPTVRNLLPQGQNLIQTCQYIMKDDNLDLLLTRHPHFGGC